MSAAQGYLLDTNIVLHATREKSPVSLAVDTQFQLRSSPFRPTISEVTIGELFAFAQAWGEKRKALLRRVIGDLLVLPISDPRIHQRWAELYSHARNNGMAIQHDHISTLNPPALRHGTECSGFCSDLKPYHRGM